MKCVHECVHERASLFLSVVMGQISLGRVLYVTSSISVVSINVVSISVLSISVV